jgi:predicted nucleotidyltransferase
MSTIDPRITTRFKADVGFDLAPHLLVLATMGSHSHGTYVPPTEPNAIDDVDLMGIVVPPLEYHIGLPRWETWRMQQDELDVVCYSLDKAVRLMLKSNPNIVGLLWLRPEDVVFKTQQFVELLMNRGMFTALTAADAFAGYAYGQLKRMEAFNVERMNEYEAYTESIRNNAGEAGVQEVLTADSNKIKHLSIAWGVRQEWLLAFQKLHKQYFSGYMGEKRKAMVRKYEYDVKNAAHLIRLLRMGKEFLETGALNVFRTHDAQELIDIKQGKWTLSQVRAEAEKLFAEVRAAEANSNLPKRPDTVRANRILMEIHTAMLGLNVQRGL